MSITATELKSNLSKYLIAAGKLEGTTLVFLKSCDTYSFNQLTKEHRVKREKTYIIGVGCHGTLKAEKVLSAGIKGIEDAAIEGDTLKVKTLYGGKRDAPDGRPSGTLPGLQREDSCGL